MIVKNRRQQKHVQRESEKYRQMLLGKHSKAESHFKKLLIDSGLYFRREKCNYKVGTRWCYYDFYLPYYQLYVELDGSSHDSKEQKQIDLEKDEIIFRKNKHILRIRNEDVLKMESVEIDGLLGMLSRQKAKDGKRCCAQQIRLKYEIELDYKRRESRCDVIRNAKRHIDFDQEVWAYDHTIGSFFCFADIFEAKFNLERSTNELLKLLDNVNYTYNSMRTLVLAYTYEECVARVQDAFC